jgi:hypothetical protein
MLRRARSAGGAAMIRRARCSRALQPLLDALRDEEASSLVGY